MSLGGRDKELYLEKVFINRSRRDDHKPIVKVTARMRADVDQDYGGAYLTTHQNPKYPNDPSKSFHDQLMSVEGFNSILKANGKPPVTTQQLLDYTRSANKNQPFMKSDANLAFRANVFSEPAHRAEYSHVFNWKSVQPTQHPFDIHKERQVEHEHHVARQQGRTQTATMTSVAPSTAVNPTTVAPSSGAKSHASHSFDDDGLTF